MAALAKRLAGVPFLSYGFRPFFMLGSTWAGLEVLAWLPIFEGRLSLATAFTPRDWHVHELLFGYVPAVIAGFLLTAIPNWTGRQPIRGLFLAGLLAAWIAGRVAVTASEALGWIPAMLLDVSFLALTAATVGREIVAAKNWRNLKIAGLLGALALANLAFHLEAHVAGTATLATRAGLALVLTMIMVVGGRIIPSFTRNWLLRGDPGRLPAAFGTLDENFMLFSVCSLLLWIVAPEEAVTGLMLVAAALLNALRLARWAGDRTLADRLVLVLHVGYVFIPVGFLLSGLATFGIVVPSAGIHAWTTGAIGIMTLAVMSRASLGHTGRPLVASPGVQVIYTLAVIAAVARICAAVHPAMQEILLPISALAWACAFLGFTMVYAPALCRSTRPARQVTI